MARSVSSRIGAATMLIPLAGLAAGCVTTQQENARTVLLNERQLASELPVQVTRENPSIRIAGLTIIQSRGQTALAVGILNTSRRPLTDLPISVGLTSPTRRFYLNRVPDLPYYQAHVSAVGAGRLVTWVLTDPRLALAAGRPFAVVGTAQSPPTTTARALPRIEVQPATATGDRLRVRVVNRSGIPQYGLQVYAVAVRGGRDVAAADDTIGELHAGGRMTISMQLIGNAGRAAIHVYALPTIFA